MGYAGTKEEMERLLADAEKLTGQEYNISNYADIVEAIHAVQTEIGITGTTAEEADKTLEGSAKAMAAEWENLKLAIAGGDINGIESSITNLVGGIETTLTNAIPVIQRILEGIGTAIESIAPIIGTELPKLITEVIPPLISATTSLVSALATALPDLLKSLFTGDTLNQVVEAGKTLFSSLFTGLTMVGELIRDNLPDLITTIVDTILGSSDDVFAAISSLIGLVGDILTNTLPVLIPKVFELVYGLIESLSSSDIFSQLTMVVIPLLTAIADGLIKAAPIVYDKLPKIITNIFDMLTKFVDEHGDEVFSQLERLFETIIEGAIELTPQLLQAMGDIITALVNGVIEYVPTFVDTVAGFFGYDNFSEMGQNVIDGILDAITGGIENIKTAASDIFNAVIEWLEQLPERAGYIFGQILGYIVQWAVDAPEKAKEAAENLFNGIVEWVQQIPDNVSTFLNDTLPKVVDWGLNLMEKGKSAAKDLFDSIVNKIEELPGKMLEIGDNLVKGIWDGITGAKDWLLDQISGFADGVLSGFKDSFGIKSPSTLMRDVIGENLALGVGVGFNSEIDDITKSMADSLETGINEEIKPIEINPDVNYDASEIVGLDLPQLIEQLNSISDASRMITVQGYDMQSADNSGKNGEPVVNNTFNISLNLEDVKISSEMDIDDLSEQAVEKLSERLQMLNIFDTKAIGGTVV